MKTPAEKSRAKLEALVWKHKHADFKGKRDDGTKCVLTMTAHGTASVPLTSLTDEQLHDMLPKKIREGLST